MTPWEFRGRELINCNCAYGCPCQFNALPTLGNCDAMGGFAIDSGHYGDVRLDGLKFAAVMHFPGPIHEGKGEVQPIVDVRANDKQREAILKILSGQDTEPGATIFQVFSACIEKVHDPIFAPIEFEVDVDARRGRVRVEGALDIKGEPILNPVTGKEHRARIDLPHGFEYEIAEVGSGSSRSQGKVAFELKNSYAQFAHLHWNNKGVIRQRAAA